MPTQHWKFVNGLKNGTTLPMVIGSSRLRWGDRQYFIALAHELAAYKLREAELIEEAERLVASNQTKEEALATVAHELRNALAPFQNAFAVMKRSERSSGTNAETIRLMERQMRQINRLVDDLIGAHRIAWDMMELRCERIDLALLVEHAVEASRPAVAASGHRLTVTRPTEPVPVDADPIRLAQVFSNLLYNAAKYTDRGGHICVTVARRGTDAVVTVGDTGVGIPSDMLSRIFEMHVQVNGTAGRSRDGLGVGLALVKRLIELHGGTVEARSEGIGRGSTFIVHLPAVRLPAPAADSCSGAESVRTPVDDDVKDRW